MEPFRTLTSLAAPLDRTNVDTDQIIPKQFLKRIERTGYGDFLFFDWRRKRVVLTNLLKLLEQLDESASGLHGVAREQQIERPIDGNADFTFERGDAREVVRSPQPPRRETGNLESADHRDRAPFSEIRHLTDHREGERSQSAGCREHDRVGYGTCVS